MRTPRVGFLGNCQAQSLESLSGHLGSDVEVVGLPPVWILGSAQRAEVEEKLSGCDYIFKQRVDKNFSVEYVQDQYVRQRYAAKVVLWPNMYFDGYFPGIQNLYRPQGKVEGPLADYHFDWILEAWKSKLSVEAAAQYALDPWPANAVSDSVERSIALLRQRERGLDVIISDYVRDRFRVRKLFYSMNHPTTELLAEMLQRLLAFAGLPHGGRWKGYAYPLDLVDIPCFASFHRIYRPLFAPSMEIKGCAVSLETNKALTESAKIFDWPGLIAEYYALYERVGLERP